MADDPTEENPASLTVEQRAVEDRNVVTAWPAGKLDAAFRALPKVGRNGAGVEANAARMLLEDMVDEYNNLGVRYVAAVDQGDGFRNDWETMRRREGAHIGRIRELEEQVKRLQGQESKALPTRAVAEVVGATRAGEHDYDLIVARARQDANRILEDARTQAARLLGVAEPGEHDDEVEDFKVKLDWVLAVGPIVDELGSRVDGLKVTLASTAARKRQEQERWGQVLPLARQLDGTIDVTEAQVAS